MTEVEESRRALKTLLAAVILLAGMLEAPKSTLAQGAACQYILGFQTLYSMDPSDVGSCVDNQAFAANGDAQQHTTTGLLAWRKADNWTAFTNGYQTWINGPMGRLAQRLNTQRFTWEANPDNLPVIPEATQQAVLYLQTAYAAVASATDALATIRPQLAATAAFPNVISSSDWLATMNPAVAKLQAAGQSLQSDGPVPTDLGNAGALVTQLGQDMVVAVQGFTSSIQRGSASGLQAAYDGLTPTTDLVSSIQQQFHSYATTHDDSLLPDAGPPPSTNAATPSATTPIAAIPAPGPSPATSAPSNVGHTFYASTYHRGAFQADRIYCDDDPGWRSLSPRYLVSYPSLDAALAALPGYHLHQPC